MTTSQNSPANEDDVDGWLWNHIGRISGLILGLIAFGGVAFLAAIGSKPAVGLMGVIVIGFLLIVVGGRITKR